MYKTAIAHVEGKISYDDALENFKTAYPEYEIRAVKQSNFGWIAFIQKEAYQDQNVQDGVPAEMDELPSPGADDVEMMEVEMGEGPEETYGEEEEKQEGLMEELEAALETVERLVSEIKDSEEDEEEVRPFDTPEEMDDEFDLEMEEGFDKEMPMTLEREKEAGVTFTSATREVEQLLKTDKEFRGYKLAGVEEKRNSFVAKLVRK